MAFFDVRDGWQFRHVSVGADGDIFRCILGVCADWMSRELVHVRLAIRSDVEISFPVRYDAWWDAVTDTFITVVEVSCYSQWPQVFSDGILPM